MNEERTCGQCKWLWYDKSRKKWYCTNDLSEWYDQGHILRDDPADECECWEIKE